MSDDDPTQWFRPRPARGDGPERADDGAAATPPPTEPVSASDAPGGAGDDATQALDRDELDELFGEQRDYSGESDWLPSGDRGTPDAATAVYGAQQPAADPLGWLGDAPGTADGSGAADADAATTVAFGAAGGSAAGGAASEAATTAYSRMPEADPVFGDPALGDPGFGAPPADPATGEGAGDEPPGSKRTLIILAAVGGLLVVGIAIALVVLFTSGSAKPSTSSSATPQTSSTPRTSASPTPSVSPSASATPSATPATPAATIGSFSASPSTPACTATSGSTTVTFSWSTTNAVKVQLSIDGGSVVNDQLSGTGTLSNVPYDCSKGSVGYTLTAYNSKGIETSKGLTLTRPTIATSTPTPTPSASASTDADVDND